MRASFDAFGKRRGSAWQGAPSSADLSAIGDATRRGYTEHSMLDNLGLIHMNGRVQDPELARFVSADPYIDGALDTQGWNRYSYVKNNPLTFTDPSGFDADDEVRTPRYLPMPTLDRLERRERFIQLYDSIARRFANNLPPPNPVPNTNTVLNQGTLDNVDDALENRVCDMGNCPEENYCDFAPSADCEPTFTKIGNRPQTTIDYKIRDAIIRGDWKRLKELLDIADAAGEPVAPALRKAAQEALRKAEKEIAETGIRPIADITKKIKQFEKKSLRDQKSVYENLKKTYEKHLEKYNQTPGNTSGETNRMERELAKMREILERRGVTFTE